ncbi:4Fe-4S binding protein [Rickettsiales bacterium LUAb2]
MALKITNECTNCGACIDVCPNMAISEGKQIYVIDPELCTECKELNYNSQCISVCPANSIIKNLELLKNK